MSEPVKYTVIYRVGDQRDFKWYRADWTNSLDYAKSQAATINELGTMSGHTMNAHAVNWLDPLPETFSYVPR